MDGISLSWRLLPQALIDRHRLENRVIVRDANADREFRFLFRDKHPIIPAWINNELCIVSWGVPCRRSRLPRSNSITQEIMEAGDWRELQPESIDIPANFGWDRGVWFRIREGIRGILVRDETNNPIVYMLTEPSSHYYQIMTRNNRMPVLVGERI